MQTSLALAGSAALLALSTSSSADVSKNAVQADLGLGVVGLGYERIVHPRVAVQIGAQVFGTWWGPYFDLPRTAGFGGQIRASIFLTEDAPRGLYVAPFFRAAAVTATENDLSGRGAGWSTGAVLGYSFMLGDRVNVRLGAGPQYMHYTADLGPTRAEWKRFHPAIDLVVGYVF